nr:Tn3 family transposase [Streptomyces sp. NBC_01591]
MGDSALNAAASSTIVAAANAALIKAQAQDQVPIDQHWGKGLLASVDGLRFVVPVRTRDPP